MARFQRLTLHFRLKTALYPPERNVARCERDRSSKQRYRIGRDIAEKSSEKGAAVQEEGGKAASEKAPAEESAAEKAAAEKAKVGESGCAS